MNKSGKSYGLIMANKTQLATPKTGNIFGGEDDSDENEGPNWVKKAIKAEGEKTRVKKQTRLNMQKALCEDPTIFQYDEVYDDMEREREELKAVKKETKKPKYINNLKKAAERRKRDYEQRIERMVQKERDEEGEKFADKEKFVTSGYRAKLEEMKKLEEEDERMDRLESICDVTKQQDMSGFYRQLFAQTVDGQKKPEETTEEAQSSREKINSSESPNIDEDDDISTDPDSSDDTDSDQSESQKNRNIRTKSKLPSTKIRQYRKRALEASESESEDEEKEKNVVNNDNDDKKEASDDEKKEKCEKDETKSTSKKLRLSIESENKVLPIEKNDDKVVETPQVLETKKLVEKKKDEDKEAREKKIEEKKVSIWEKRTVGPVFDSALQRYYARKALRLSGC